MYIAMRKKLRFYGSSKKDLRAFPKSARAVAGTQLFAVQLGAQPTDWKPMPSIGRGVEELRVAVEGGAFRVVYVARFADHVCILHAFQKKTFLMRLAFRRLRLRTWRRARS